MEKKRIFLYMDNKSITKHEYETILIKLRYMYYMSCYDGIDKDKFDELAKKVVDYNIKKMNKKEKIQGYIDTIPFILIALSFMFSILFLAYFVTITF